MKVVAGTYAVDDVPVEGTDVGGLLWARALDRTAGTMKRDGSLLARIAAGRAGRRLLDLRTFERTDASLMRALAATPPKREAPRWLTNMAKRR